MLLTERCSDPTRLPPALPASVSLPTLRLDREDDSGSIRSSGHWLINFGTCRPRGDRGVAFGIERNRPDGGAFSGTA